MPNTKEDFREGDYVEIQAGNKFPYWNGKRGHVVVPNEESLTYAYLNVKVSGEVDSAWWPHHLIKINEEAEAAAILGEDFFA